MLHAHVQEDLETWFSTFGSLTRLTRFISCIFRWRANSKLPLGHARDFTESTIHLSEARAALIKATQLKFYKEEISILKRGKVISRSSSIRRFAPMITQDEMLRVGGRLQNSDLNYEKRHPPILPKQSHLTKLLIRDAHLRTLHGGPQLVQNLLREKY